MLQLAAWLESRRSDVRSGGERSSTPAEASAALSVTSTVRPAGVGTPFSRFRARLSLLTPKSTSLEDYHAWLQGNALGSDPDGYWYDDMVALLERNPLLEADPEPTPTVVATAEPTVAVTATDPVGSPLATPVPTVVAMALPTVGTPENRGDLDDAQDELDDAQDELDDDPVPPMAACISPSALPTLAILEPAGAAERFIEWVRLADRCGTYSHREMSELSEEFFAAEDLEPIADNLFRPALEAMSSAVIKSCPTIHLGRGRRQRCRKWTILEAETMEETALPWEELSAPQRRAA